MPELESHPLYDRLPHEMPPFSFPKPADCPDALCLLPFTRCAKCPRKPPAVEVKPVRPSWGGRRSGAGAPKGSFNHLKTGSRSVLLRRAVEVLAEHKELRPFLLLLARAAIEGKIPQTTRRLILASLGKKTAGIQVATIQLRRLRDGKTAR